jgi:hypothetical protein
MFSDLSIQTPQSAYFILLAVAGLCGRWAFLILGVISLVHAFKGGSQKLAQTTVIMSGLPA